MRKLLLSFIAWLSRFVRPDDELLATALVINVSQLAIPHGEWLELAGLKGCCGNIRLSGNSLPVFEYRVFEKSLMEFIAVRVEVALPDRIRFVSRIDSQYTQDPKRHGEEVETKERYKQIFYQLATHLHAYFPYPRISKELEDLKNEKMVSERQVLEGHG
jgi:hypothetical protein